MYYLQHLVDMVTHKAATVVGLFVNVQGLKNLV